MPSTTQTEYLLRMELIALDERLCRTIERTASLCERAQKYDETTEAERIRKVNKVLTLTKRALDRLSSRSGVQSDRSHQRVSAH